MANGFYGDKAIVLPSLFPRPGEVMQQGLESSARQGQQLAGALQEKIQDQQEEEYKKTKLLQVEFDPKNIQTPSQKANEILGKTMQQTFEEVAAKAKELNYNDLYTLAHTKLTPILQTAAGVKNRIAEEESKMTIAQKEFQNTNYSLLHEDLGNNIISDFFTKDAEGNYIPNLTSAVGQSGTLASLKQSNPGRYIKSLDPLFNYFGEGIKPEKGGQKVKATAQTEYKGVRDLTQFDGMHSKFYQLNGTPDASGFLPGGKIPQLQLVTETLPNGLPAVPKELFDQTIGADPERMEVFEVLWGAKRPANIVPNSSEDDMLKRNFLTQIIPSHDPSYLSPVEKQSNANIVNRIQLGLPAVGSGGSGGKTKKEELTGWATQTKDAIVSGDMKAIKQQFGKAYGGNGRYDFEKAQMVEDRGNPNTKRFVITYKTGSDIDGNPIMEKKVIYVKDPNLENQLLGLGQDFFGSETKDENTVYYDKPTSQPAAQTNSKPAKTNSKPAQTNSKPAQKKYKGLDKNGNPIFQ